MYKLDLDYVKTAGTASSTFPSRAFFKDGTSVRMGSLLQCIYILSCTSGLYREPACGVKPRKPTFLFGGGNMRQNVASPGYLEPDPTYESF